MVISESIYPCVIISVYRTAAAAIRSDNIATLMDMRQQEDLKELRRMLNEFNFSYQKVDQRREYDLYDPDRLKKDKPARVCDDDPRCGVSSIQKFDGEDLNGKNRTVAQREQVKNWLDMQISAKTDALNAHRQAQRLYDLKQLELDKRTCDLMEAEDECRRAVNKAMSNYNEALSLENAAKERLVLQQQEDDRRMHIANALASDLLTENPSQAASALGPQRVIPDRFKGMTPDQLQRVYDEQKRQIDEKKVCSRISLGDYSCEMH